MLPDSIFLAVYPLRYAIHLGSLGCLEEARVAVVLCCPKVMKLPQGDAWFHQLCCLFLVVRLTKPKGKVSRLWLVKTSGMCWK